MSKATPHLTWTTGGDAVPGGYNGYFAALGSDGKAMGRLDYQLITDRRYDDGEVGIAWIEVLPAYRRRGIGLALLARLQGEFPGREIDWGYRTEDGEALYQAWLRTRAHVHARPA